MNFNIVLCDGDTIQLDEDAIIDGKSIVENQYTPDDIDDFCIRVFDNDLIKIKYCAENSLTILLPTKNIVRVHCSDD